VPFRAAVRRALADPLGGPLARHFAVPAVTAIVADGDAGEPGAVALAELTEAMVRVGVPRGRMFVLLTGAATPGARERERARELRDTLGMAVIPHDPVQAAFEPGRLAGGAPLALDDELREAEAVVVCGRFAADARGGLHGGPAALLPGLASAEARAAHEAALPAGGPAARAAAALAASLAVLEHVTVDFALAWSGGDPPEVMAGAGREVFDACVASGWAAPREVGPLNPPRAAS
jgi:nickel-dependent lactate racemase